MKSKTLKIVVVLVIIMLSLMAFAQTASDLKPRGFIDLNNDGINDWFCDANGDGINDIDNQPYRHTFQFQDRNGDGINDLFVDKDGDGVNDLVTGFVDLDGDGWNDNVIDCNHDWINDITGLRYNRRNPGGGRYGFIWEERGGISRGAHNAERDENAPGSPSPNMQHRRGVDQFIDTDGDGINDNRGFDRHRQGSGHNRRKG